MSLELKLIQTPVLQARQVQEDPIGKVYALRDYWDSQTPITISFDIGERTHETKYVLAPESFIKYMSGGDEIFGGYVNDMMFISSKLAQEHPEWAPYVAFKLYSERFVDEGKDNSGKVKHWQALLGTMRLAGMTMSQGESEKFLEAIRPYETTRGFDMLREAYDNFIESGAGDPIEAKRKYLERHHGNRWVNLGRLEESFIDFGRENSGFRNHSEAIFRATGGDTNLDTNYSLASFVRALNTAEIGESIVIPEEYAAFAYALTKECNDVSDLIEFVKDVKLEDTRSNVIRVLPHKERTWEGLSRRLSFGLHRAELAAGEATRMEKERLEGIVYQIGEIGETVRESVENIRSSISIMPFNEVSLQIKNLTGDYQNILDGLDKQSKEAVANLASLEELALTLRASI